MRPGVERILATRERLPVDVGAGRDPICRSDQAADLRRHDEVVSRPALEHATEATLRGPIAIQGCHVEVADPQRPGPFDGPLRLVVADLTEEPAHGRRSETESSDLEIGPLDPHPLERFVGHGDPLVPVAASIDVTPGTKIPFDPSFA